MKLELTYIIKRAQRLNAIIRSPNESKNGRNAAITAMSELERETGWSLRRS